jgi:transposase
MASELKVPFDIPDVTIIGSEVTSDNQLLIRVESALETITCGCCDQTIRCNAGHGQELKLRHLPVLGLETYVLIRPRRGKCPHCWPEAKTTQVVGWYEQRSPHTKAYDEYLLKQLVNSTIEDVSLKERIGYDAVVGALDRQLDVTINWAEIADLHTVGIDEIALRKGRKAYAAIVTAKQSNSKVRVLAVLPDRKKQA